MLFALSCLTLCNPMDYSPPGSSVHGILQARILEWVAIPLFQGIVPTQGWNPGLCLHCRQILYCLSHQGSPEQCCYCSVAELCLTLCNPMDCRRMWFSTKRIFSFLSINLGTCWVCILDESICGFPMYTQLFSEDAVDKMKSVEILLRAPGHAGALTTLSVSGRGPRWSTFLMVFWRKTEILCMKNRSTS